MLPVEGRGKVGGPSLTKRGLGRGVLWCILNMDNDYHTWQNSDIMRHSVDPHSRNTDLCRKTSYIYRQFDDNVTTFFKNYSTMPADDPWVQEQREQYMEQVGAALGRNITDTDIMILNGSGTVQDPVTEYWQ